jgi:hypothetical protein
LSVVSVVCCLCDELITRPEESYRLWCVVVSDLEISRIWGGHDPCRVAAPQEKKKIYIYIYMYIYAKWRNVSSSRKVKSALVDLLTWVGPMPELHCPATLRSAQHDALIIPHVPFYQTQVWVTYLAWLDDSAKLALGSVPG